jgi:hypothetical protein
MADEPALLYLEPDDEITSLVRRLRESDSPRVVVVAPGRAKATSSAMALRLLARIAADAGREVSIVGDALTRSLAAEADLTAFTSVADARAARPAAPVEPQRAAISVLRGDGAAAATPAVDALAATQPVAVAVAPPPSRPRTEPGRGDETRIAPAVHRPASRPAPSPGPRGRPGPARRRGWAIAGAAVLLLAFGLVGAAVAFVAPAATITLQAGTEPVGPRSYELVFADPTVTAGTVSASIDGTATGEYHDLTPANGVVTFFNWSLAPVNVPAGTGVAAGEVVFGTTAEVLVPAATIVRFFPQVAVQAGEANAQVQAVNPGPAGNVAAGAIDTVTNEEVAAQLRNLPDNPEQLVTNVEATAGGIDESGSVVAQEDVDAAVAALHDQLATAAQEALGDPGDAPYVDPAEAPQPQVSVPDDLVGSRDVETFALEGTLEYRRVSVEREEVDAEGHARLEGDAAAVGTGRTILAETVRVDVTDARLDGEALVVAVEVRGASAPVIDRETLRAELLGLRVEEAAARLRPLGAVDISTWPGWVDRIPRLDWRVEMEVIEADPRALPSPSHGATGEADEP